MQLFPPRQALQTQRWHFVPRQPFPTQQMFSLRRQFTSSHVSQQTCGLPNEQPLEEASQQQSWTQFPQQHIPQQYMPHQQYSSVHHNNPQQAMQQLNFGTFQQQQFIPQHAVSQTQSFVPPQELVPQTLSETSQQPAQVSYPSTSSQTVLAQHPKTRHQYTTQKEPYSTSRQKSHQAVTEKIQTRVLTNMYTIIFNENFATTAVHYNIKIDPVDKCALTKHENSQKQNKPKPKRELKNKNLLRCISQPGI